MFQQLLAYNQKSEGKFEALTTKVEALTSHMKKMDIQLAQQAEAIRRQPGTLPGQPEGNPRVEHVNVITLISENGGEQHLDAPTPVLPERIYIPKVPYPLHLYKPRVPAPTKEAPPVVRPECVHVSNGKSWPAMQHVVEGMDTSQIIDAQGTTTGNEEECALIAKEFTVVLPREIPPKLDDPGNYSIPVKIGLTDFPTSLCDLGSSVNLMPHSTAKRLGFNKLEPTNISLMFADRSLKAPLGILVDVPVQVGPAVVPVDFVVLEIEDEPPEPLILGRPFLRTAGANIDVKNGIIQLHIGTHVLHFLVDASLDSQPPSAPDPYDVQAQILAPVVPIYGISEPPWRDEHEGNGNRKLIYTDSHFGDPSRA